MSLSREGTQALYYSLFARYFSTEDPLPESGTGLRVARRYYRIQPDRSERGRERGERSDSGNPFLKRHYTAIPSLYDPGEAAELLLPNRERLEPGAQLRPGDLVEVEFHIQADHALEYLLFEDIKPATCDPDDTSSGWVWAGVWAYRELREQKIAFFAPQIPGGSSWLRYHLRAEGPGELHVLPTLAYAMYSPEYRANTAEMRLVIRDS